MLSSKPYPHRHGSGQARNCSKTNIFCILGSLAKLGSGDLGATMLYPLFADPDTWGLLCTSLLGNALLDKGL